MEGMMSTKGDLRVERYTQRATQEAENMIRKRMQEGVQENPMQEEPDSKRRKDETEEGKDKDMGWSTFTPDSVYPEFEASGPTGDETPIVEYVPPRQDGTQVDTPEESGDVILSLWDARGKLTQDRGRNTLYGIADRGDMVCVTGGLQEDELGRKGDIK